MQELGKLLVPRLLSVGFDREDLNEAERSEPQMRIANPLGFFRRERDRSIDLVDVTFDPRGDPRFVLVGSRISESGVDLPWGSHIEASNAHAGDALEFVILKDKWIRRKWFGPRLFGAPRDGELRKIAQTATDKFSQIEDWLVSGRVGPNLIVRQIS